MINMMHVGLVWVVSLGAAAWFAFGLGQDHEIAKAKKQEELVAAIRQAAIEGAAHEISKIRIENTTIRQRAETIIREVPVYRDCVHPDGMLDNINEALTGKPAGDRSVPRAKPPDR